MEGKIASTRHFFKVMMPGFSETLNLPPAFCKKLITEKSEWAIIKSRKGTWKIKAWRNREDLICFQDGWPGFVHHHGLSIGDLVVFEHTGDFCFMAYVFDSSACEKEFRVDVKKEPTEAVDPNHQHHPKSTNKRGESENAHFVLTMKPYHADKKARVYVPVEFTKSNNLWENSSVALRDPHGRTWPVKVAGRLRMQSGWRNFYVSNQLKDGDVCHFNLNRHLSGSTTLIMDVLIFRSPSKNTIKSEPHENEVRLPMLVRDLRILALNPFHGVETNCQDTTLMVFLKYRSLSYQKISVLWPPMVNETNKKSTSRDLTKPSKCGEKRVPSDRVEAIEKKKMKLDHSGYILKKTKKKIIDESKILSGQKESSAKYVHPTAPLPTALI